MSFATLTEAMTAFQALTGKTDGDLIKAQEWNDLVNGVIRIGTDLAAVTGRVSDLEAFVGFSAGWSGDNLTQRLDALGTYVGTAGDAPGPTTLSSRVAALEQADNVTQTEFDGLEQSVAPLLEQYIVRFQTDDADYLLGEAATITATVRTLKNEIPHNRPWIDFIATWGRLKAVSGFEAREGSGMRSMAVRVNTQGVARVQVTAEQNKSLSIEEEDQVAQFFQTALADNTGRFREVVKKAATPQDEPVAKCYQAASREYESSRKAFQKLADDYYREKITGGRGEAFWPSNNWKKYRSTVVGFVTNDADPTSPDPCRGVSSIQLLFKDWIGPWVNGYVEEDDDDVFFWDGHFGNWKDMDPDDFLDHVEIEMDESIFQRGVVGRDKGLKALAKAADKIIEENIKDPGGWVKRIVRDAAEAQRSTLALQQDIGDPEVMTAGSGAAMRVAFVQGKQADAAGRQAAQAKDEVLASSEFGSLQTAVSRLEDSTTNAGRNILGALQDIEHKVVNINAFDSAALQTSVNEIKAKIGVTRNLVPG